MPDPYDQTIELLLSDIKLAEGKVIEDKKLVNQLAARAGRQPVFPEAELSATGTLSSPAKKAEFFNKPLTSAIKAFLSRRYQHPASAEEIHTALLAGGYDQFPAKKEDAINGLRISIGKNVAVFAKIPDGDNFLYGLNTWYGINKRQKGAGNGKEDEADTEVDTAKDQAADVDAKGGEDDNG